MTQRIIDWPAVLRPGAQEWHLIQPMVSSTSAFSGATFDKLIGPPRWAFSLDVPDQPARMLPAIESAVRSFRGGLNLVRVGDMRRTRLALGPLGGRVLSQLLPWTAWARWERVGPEPAVAGEVLTAQKASAVHQLTQEPVRTGLQYTAVLEVTALTPVHAALGIAGPGVANPLGVVVNAQTGEVVSQYGPVVASGSVAEGGFHRVWVRFRADADQVVHLTGYAMQGTYEPTAVQLRRPVLAMHALMEPEPFVPSSGMAVWGDAQITIDGADQTGDVLATAGWLPNTRIEAGHWLNYGDGMHQLIEYAAVDGEGRATLRIEPPIRRSPVHAAPVTIRNVTSLFKLKTQPRIRQEGMVVKGFTLEFEEWQT